MEAAALISEAYRQEQQWLHTSERKWKKYGSGGPQWADAINDLIEQHACSTVIDYGCGKGLLAKHLRGVIVRSYDPAMTEFATLPEKADLLICLDVLEHIEPGYLPAVLDHLVSLAPLLFVSISLKSTARTLRDGRNAHLIVKDAAWWENKLKKRGCKLQSVFTRPAKAKELVGLWIRS